MSDAVFPTLRGLTWPVEKVPVWNTKKQMTPTGRSRRATYMSYPNYRFKLIFSYLGDKQAEGDDIRTLLGFINQRNGGVDSFLFKDDSDFLVADQPLGVGDGETTVYQLIRTYGGFVEPVFGIKAAPVITVGGVATAAFTWTTSGRITFDAPPALGAQIAASFSFYYRVFLDQDEPGFSRLMHGIWELKTLELFTEKP